MNMTRFHENQIINLLLDFSPYKNTMMPYLKTCIFLVVVIFATASCSALRNSEQPDAVDTRSTADKPGNGGINSGQSDGRGLAQPRGMTMEAENMSLRGYKAGSDGRSGFAELQEETGIARFDFSFPSGYYDIDVRFLSENVGQNTYAMYIADNQIVAWLGKDRDDQWHLLSEQKWHSPRNIAIKKGDEIRIEALSENGSRVIFDYVEFTPSARSIIPAPDTVSIPEVPSTPMPPVDAVTQADLVTMYPEEYDGAIKNPLKGFRPSTLSSGIENRFESYNPSVHEHQFGLLIKNYIRWNELENYASDDVNKIREVCNLKWRGVEKRNIKIIPRVYLEWPRREHGWPGDMTPGDYTSDQFRQRLLAFIEKLGKAWDNDPRVAYIEMGLIGEWGEMEYPDTGDEIKKAMAAQFNTSFRNKLVMIRWPNTYNDHMYNFGYYWDSFAHLDQEYCGFHIHNTAPKWKTAVIGGETAYNWGNVHIQPGRTPDESLTKAVHRDYIIDRIRKLHANHLGWIADYDQHNDSVRAGAEILQKALGYRFVIQEVNYPVRIETGVPFMVSFKVVNTGSSPLYYNWPVELSLLDPDTRQAAWKEQFTRTDLRNWMPGDQWDESTDSYAIPAETNTVQQTFTLTGIPSGTYILALAILDPSGNRPCVRFAIRNYYKGGRHPIGKVGINHTLDSFDVSAFDEIRGDTLLSYDRMFQ